MYWLHAFYAFVITENSDVSKSFPFKCNNLGNDKLQNEIEWEFFLKWLGDIGGDTND